MAFWKHLLGLKPVRKEWYGHSPRPVDNPAGDTLEITYLGTAGFILRGRGRTVVLDPYLTRPGLRQILFSRLRPEAELIRATIPQVDDVLIGHAHYDHILDAPELCRQTGARLIGSSSAIMVGRAAGLPREQMCETAGREDIACGTWTVHGLPSRHGKLLGHVPLPGDIKQPPSWPPHARDLKHGLVLNWIVDTGSLRVVHIDSADFINEELAGVRADVVCLCAIGRKARPNYVKDVVALLKPRWIIPCHWDTMLTPLHAEPELIPGVDLPGFLQEIREADCEPLLMPLLGRMRLASDAETSAND